MLSSDGEKYLQRKFLTADPEVLRRNGNEFLKNGDYRRAISFYTKSLSMAKAGCKQRGLAYANRSAVLLSLGLYKECISDVDEAFANNYPAYLAIKLHKRKAVSYQALKNEEKAKECLQAVSDATVALGLISKEGETLIEAVKQSLKTEHVPEVKHMQIKYSDPPALSYGSQKEENPSLSTGLKTRPHPESRFSVFVAARDFSVGDVVIVEEAEMHAPSNEIGSEDHYWTHCHECLRLCLNLMPCLQCSWACYCSDNCRSTAWEKYHSVECGPKKRAVKEFVRKTDLNVLRGDNFLSDVPFKLISNLGIENCLTALDSKQRVKKDAHPTIKKIFDLAKKRDMPAGQYILMWLVATSFGLGETDTLKLAVFLRAAMPLYAENCINNVEFDLVKCGHNRDYGEVYSFAWGFYPTVSRLNTSRDPNTIMCFYRKTIVLKVCRPIAIGEEISISAGSYNFGQTSLKVLQTQTMKSLSVVPLNVLLQRFREALGKNCCITVSENVPLDMLSVENWQTCLEISKYGLRGKDLVYAQIASFICYYFLSESKKFQEVTNNSECTEPLHHFVSCIPLGSEQRAFIPMY